MAWKLLRLHRVMNLNFKPATPNEEMLLLGIAVIFGLLFISAVGILLLLRKVRKMGDLAEKLESQILGQQKRILDIRSDANAWRGEMQRQFDAFRAESSRWCAEQEVSSLEISA
jgi:hypothetical protein